MGIRDMAFRAYAALYNCAAKKPVKENSAVLFSLHEGGFQDSLGEIEKELKKRGYKVKRIDREDLERGPLFAIKFLTVDAVKMARAKYLFMNNNFFPMGWMNPNPETTVIQVWHGLGAFKKFGFHIEQPPEVREKEIGANRNIDYVVCSAETIRPIYSEAFGLDPKMVITTGCPIEDYYFKKENTGKKAIAKKRKKLNRKYPRCKNRFLLLYAPTFRDWEGDSPVENMDFDRLISAAEKGTGKKVQVLVRLHPKDTYSKEKLKEVVKNNVKVLDFTDYPNGNELTVLSDLLITDYSSICMLPALLNKNMIFYAYDFDRFQDARSFYYDYMETVPGPVAQDMDSLVEILESGNFRNDRMESFRKLHFGNPDGKATKHLLDQVL